MALDELLQEINFGLENLASVYQHIVQFSALQSDQKLKTSALAYECLGYYNAVEHLMIRVLKNLDREIPTGAFSHRDVLKAFQNVAEANRVNDSEVMIAIENLMAFRHVATKIYGFLIDWARLQIVVSDIQKLHIRILRLFQVLSTSLKENK
jgi:hypothetical protein